MPTAKLAKEEILRRAFTGRRVLVTGGTGSLGKVLLRRLLEHPVESVKVISRDEAKQYFLSKEINDPRLSFQIGDVRNLTDVTEALQDIDYVFNAAALKQVPTCEYAAHQAVRTNIDGPENIVKAIAQNRLPVQKVICISTDKACKPVNVMGMTKAIQERIFIQGNLRCPGTTFVCARYGNILASRGSLIPLFHKFIEQGKPLTVTTEDMTRFLLNLDEAVDLIFDALTRGEKGEIFIPRVMSGKILDIAEIFEEMSDSKIVVTGLRPGEKVHEILIAEEEASRTYESLNRYIIAPQLKELMPSLEGFPKIEEYSSNSALVDKETLRARLDKEQLLPGQFKEKL